MIQGHVHFNMSLYNIPIDQRLIIHAQIVLKEQCLHNDFIRYVNLVWSINISKCQTDRYMHVCDSRKGVQFNKRYVCIDIFLLRFHLYGIPY